MFTNLKSLTEEAKHKTLLSFIQDSHIPMPDIPKNGSRYLAAAIYDAIRQFDNIQSITLTIPESLPFQHETG